MFDIPPDRELHLETEAKGVFKDGTIVFYESKLNEIYIHLHEIAFQVANSNFSTFWNLLFLQHCLNCELSGFLESHNSNLRESWDAWKVAMPPIPFGMFRSRGQMASKLYAFYCGFSIPFRESRDTRFLPQVKLDDPNLITIDPHVRQQVRMLVLTMLDGYLQDKLIDAEYSVLRTFAMQLSELHAEDSHEMVVYDNLKAVVCFSANRQYVGHVYLEELSSKMCGFGGIRSTVFLKRKSQLALKLIHGIQLYCFHHPQISTLYIFLTPIGFMREILEKMGFKDRQILLENLHLEPLQLRFVF